MKPNKTWIFLAVFLVIYLSFRLFWLGGDPGVPSVWEYGYNATDEGYYLDGGKEKFLWDRFVDLPRMEAFTYGFSSGTHWLSYLAHSVFGLSTWTWRIPFFTIACLAWISVFIYLSRKSNAFTAFLLCTAFSSIPMQIAYERTASNDVLIGSLTVLAYVIATGKSRWRLFAAAFVTSLIVLVKPSVWLLIPVVASGILQTPKFKRPWLDLVVYVATALGCVFLCKLLAAVAVLPDAHHAGVGIWEIVRRTTTHYPLPNLFDFESHFKGISAFPRDPSYALLGVSSFFLFGLPIAMAMKNIFGLRFNGNTLLFVSVPVYVAAVNVMNTLYTHYLIPVLMVLPILLEAVSSEVELDGSSPVLDWKKILPRIAFVLAACFLGLLFLSTFKIDPRVAQQYYSRIYNFPPKNVWETIVGPMAVYVVSIVATLSFVRGFSHARRYVLAWIVAAFFTASSVFAAIPAIQLAPFLRQSSALAFAPMGVSLTVASLMLVSVFGGLGGSFRNRSIAAFVFVSMAICYLVTPNWRQSACELFRAPTHHHADAAKELAAILPDDAIVIGERSNQMLLSLPIRTATTFAANSDPIPVIRSILASEPSAKLYALADSEHAYNLQHYREHSSEYLLHPIKVFRMPSFGTGSLTDVYLCKIDVVSGK